MAYIPQLSSDDEFIVVADGPIDEARALCKELPIRFMETPEHIGDYGCTPCDYAIERAKGDYVLFIGDDDLPTAEAVSIIKKGLTNRPDLPHLFATYHTNRVLLDSLECGHVTGQQIVVPRDMSKMPKMADVEFMYWRVSDWVFINKVVQAWRGIVYHPDIICYMKQQNYGEKNV
jgi:glycosyltransferase involved in cell wall biosynthesis